MASTNSTLRRIFAEHDVQLVDETDWLTTNGGYPACRGTVTVSRTKVSDVSVRLDVEVALDEHRSIVESFGDGGKNFEDANRNAFFNFSQSSLHVLLSALWDVHDDDQVLREEWTLDQSPWQLFMGNIVRKAWHGITVPVPNGLFPTIESAVRSLKVPKEIRWVRFYYANMNRTNQIVEVLLNNEPWDDCMEAIQRIDWPESETFYSCRMFLILKPAT